MWLARHARRGSLYQLRAFDGHTVPAHATPRRLTQFCEGHVSSVLTIDSLGTHASARTAPSRLGRASRPPGGPHPGASTRRRTRGSHTARPAVTAIVESLSWQIVSATSK